MHFLCFGIKIELQLMKLTNAQVGDSIFLACSKKKELEKIYPNMKEDELQLMLSLMSKKEFKELLEQHG